jgi:hypothetical protein
MTFDFLILGVRTRLTMKYVASERLDNGHYIQENPFQPWVTHQILQNNRIRGDGMRKKFFGVGFSSLQSP